MQGIKRRVTYVALYESTAFAITSTAFFLFSDKNAAHATTLGIITVLLAISWNWLFNSLFEAWEARQVTRGRSLWRRVAHACGFEIGFIAITLPLFAWWLDLSLVDAFVLDLGLTLFFMVFTFAYNWLFDLAFGLPLSAQ